MPSTMTSQERALDLARQAADAIWVFESKIVRTSATRSAFVGSVARPIEAALLSFAAEEVDKALEDAIKRTDARQREHRGRDGYGPSAEVAWAWSRAAVRALKGGRQ